MWFNGSYFSFAKFGYPLGVVDPSTSAAQVKMIWQRTILAPSTHAPS